MFKPVTNDDPLVRVHERAEELLKLHGLWEQGWRFELSQQANRLGECNYYRKLIRYSAHWLKSDWEIIEDTLLHEIAHALAGPRHGHNYYWKSICRQIGARPERLAEPHAVTTKKYNYVMQCPNCKREWKRYRMRKRNFGSRCPACNVEVKIFRYVRS